MLNVIEIKDFNAPELDIYARCTEARLLNKDHPEEGMFIAESPKVIGRALDAGYEPLSVLVEKKQMEENEETSQIMNRFSMCLVMQWLALIILLISEMAKGMKKAL